MQNFINNLKSKVTSGLNKISTFKLKKKHLPIILIATVVLTFLIVFLISNKPYFEKLNTDYMLLNPNNGLGINIGSIREYPQPKTESNPINGNLITKEKLKELGNKKIFGVMVNNHPDARPQSALSQADMVMEVLTEGGITRYVALFYENEPEKIGPVRSLRRYMVDFLAEFDSPVLLHEGWASFHGFEPVYVRETDAARDVFQFNMKTMQSPASRYRDEIKGNKAGYVHSLYTSYELIATEFERLGSQLGWESITKMEELKWKLESPIEERGEFKSVAISFLSLGIGISDSGFEYNKETNSYDRLIVGKPDIDELTNQRISPKNVILEWHKYRLANDGYSRIIIDMIGEGEATLLRDGHVIEATWKKEDRTARTRYYDKDGNELELNRGQIWKVVLNKIGNEKLSTVTMNIAE